jgi:hypothetical protein
MVKVVAGVDDGRGDEVVVRTLADLGGRRDQVAATLPAAAAGAAVEVVGTGAPPQVGDAGESVATTDADQSAPREVERQPSAASPPAPGGLGSSWLIAGIVAVGLIAVALAVALRARTKPELSAAERERLLAEIRRALGDEEAAGKGAQP